MSRRAGGLPCWARFVLESRLNWLLLLVPLSLLLDLLRAPSTLVFAVSALAIIPLAELIGRTTEQLANRVGPGLGGFLNATFGNATELIISLFALHQGLITVVQAGISGSIIGNILLSLGLAMFLGGWGREKQLFNRTRAGANAALLFLATVALVMPAVFDLAVAGTLAPRTPGELPIGFLVSIVLLGTYTASLLFSLRTHRSVFQVVAIEPQERQLSLRESASLLLVVTVVTAVEAELLVSTISTAAAALGISELFTGVIVIGTIGNAAEYYSALSMARKDRMELAMNIAAGSATQIALFVAPLLVLVSFAIRQPLSLVFSIFEVAGVTLSVLAFAIVSLDGESTWFEGVELVAVYLVLAIVLFFVPGG